MTPTGRHASLGGQLDKRVTALLGALDKLPGMRLGARERLDVIALASRSQLSDDGPSDNISLANQIAALLAKSETQWSLVSAACGDALAAIASENAARELDPITGAVELSRRRVHVEAKPLSPPPPLAWRRYLLSALAALGIAGLAFIAMRPVPPVETPGSAGPEASAPAPATEAAVAPSAAPGAADITESEVEDAARTVDRIAGGRRSVSLWQIAGGLSRAGDVSRMRTTVYKALQRHSGLPTVAPLDLSDGETRRRLVEAVLALEHSARLLPPGISETVSSRVFANAASRAMSQQHEYPSAPDGASPPGWSTLAAALALPLAAFVLWLWRVPERRRRHAEDVLAGGSGRHGARIDASLVDPAPLARERALLRSATRQLDGRAVVPTRDIDVEATIAATIARGGMFTPRVAMRAGTPEYLALILSHGSHDQEAARLSYLVDEIADGTTAASTFRRRGRIERRYLEHDADRAFALPGDRRSTIEDLVAATPGHRLMLLGSGEGLLDAADLEIKPWALGLRQWPVRALATPVPPAEWGRREAQLSLLMQGPLFRATASGLVEMTAYLREKAADEGEIADYVATHSRIWRRDLHRFQIELPHDEERDWRELAAELESYLVKSQNGEAADDRGLRWVRALAVYPVLRWDLTSYLGVRLKAADSTGLSQPLYDEEIAARLGALPWFRHGRIPRWIRRRLIADLGERDRVEVLRAIGELLVSPADVTELRHAIRLPVADPQATAHEEPGGTIASRDAATPLDDLAANDQELLDLVAAAPLETLVRRSGVGWRRRLSGLPRRFALVEWLAASVLVAYVAAAFALVPKPWSGTPQTGAWWPQAILVLGLLLLPYAAWHLRRAFEDGER